MDLSHAFDSVVSLVRSSDDPDVTWERLVDYAIKATSSRAPEVLRSFSAREQARNLEVQLSQLFRTAPIPETVDTLYFGLFESVASPSGSAGAGYYVAGVTGYRPEDPDSLVDPDYFPENRFLFSPLLEAVKSLPAAQGQEHEFYEYALMLGGAALLAKHATSTLAGRYRLVVGFDSGDVAEL